jgi:hypothetical protein
MTLPPTRTACALLAVLLFAVPARADVALPSLRLEDLTWTEVADALADGCGCHPGHDARPASRPLNSWP